MNLRSVFLALAAPLLFMMACAPGAARAPAAGESPAPAAPAPPPAVAASAVARSAPLPREANPDDPLCAPLLLEQDFSFGTHVVMRRLPNTADLEDLRFINGLRQVVLALPEWPTTYAELKPLQQVILPDGVEIVVLLPGWPPTHEALGAWNLVGGALRVIIVVDGPPADRALIAEMNRMRPLERIIAQMDQPSRTGFERLQRPLSFRVLKR
jgi:hypothetical protein